MKLMELKSVKAKIFGMWYEHKHNLCHLFCSALPSAEVAATHSSSPEVGKGTKPQYMQPVAGYRRSTGSNFQL